MPVHVTSTGLVTCALVFSVYVAILERSYSQPPRGRETPSGTTFPERTRGVASG